MGSGSDFTAFQDFAGIPCIDMGFKGAPDGPVYQYHSNYDSFHWMDEYGDPGFKYHEAMAKVLGVLVGELSNTIVIPFGAAEYADALDGYLNKVEDKLMSTREPTSDAEIFALRGAVSSKDVTGSADAFEESLKTVRKSLATLRVKAAELDERAAWANRQLEKGLPWWNIIGKIKLWTTIASTNTQYKYFERYFLFEGGLDSRSWFKHVVFAPGLWTGYAGGESHPF